MAAFRIIALDHTLFEPLFAMDDVVLRTQGVLRVRADEDFGFPCRVSLEDARAGDELLLLPFTHHAVETPYRASGPIYVRRAARQRVLPPGYVPESVTRRLMSLRAYDSRGMMLASAVVDGTEAGEAVARYFEQAEVACVHLHNAKPGCYACRALRA